MTFCIARLTPLLQFLPRGETLLPSDQVSPHESRQRVETKATDTAERQAITDTAKGRNVKLTKAEWD